MFTTSLVDAKVRGNTAGAALCTIASWGVILPIWPQEECPGRLPGDEDSVRNPYTRSGSGLRRAAVQGMCRRKGPTAARWPSISAIGISEHPHSKETHGFRKTVTHSCQRARRICTCGGNGPLARNGWGPGLGRDILAAARNVSGMDRGHSEGQ